MASVDAGDLRIVNGPTQLDHQYPYWAKDLLAAVWQPGDAITVSASGATVPAFSTTVPLPPRITFLEPDLKTLPNPLPDVLTLRWTPTQATGTVEATGESSFIPDGTGDFTTVHCSAPLSAGELTIAIPGGQAPIGLSIGRSLSVRVVNATRIQTPVLTADVRVASFDSGPITGVPPNPDGGADAN